MGTEAYHRWVLPAKDKFYRFACSILGNSDEAADVVQEVLVNLWENRGELGKIQNVEAWGMRLVRNQALNRLKSAHYRQTQPIAEKSAFQYEQPGPFEQAATDDTMQHIQKMIGELPPVQQQIVQLRDVEGYSYQEICEILEADANYVKVNLFRARQALRKKLLALKLHN